MSGATNKDQLILTIIEIQCVAHSLNFKLQCGIFSLNPHYTLENLIENLLIESYFYYEGKGREDLKNDGMQFRGL